MFQFHDGYKKRLNIISENTIKVMVLLLIFFFFTGCSVSPKIQSDFEKKIQAIFSKEMVLLQEMEASGTNTTLVEMSFAQALKRSVARNSEIRHYMLTHDKTLIDGQQAKSLAWPRVFLDFSGEQPIGTDISSEDAVISYGLFLRYDIIEAFFYQEEVAINKVKQNQNLHKKTQIIKKIYITLLGLLTEIEFNSRKKDLLTNAFAITEKALERSVEIGLNTSGALENNQKLQASARRFKRQLKENQFVLKRLNEKLNHILGIRYGSTVIVLDQKDHFPQSLELTSPESISARQIKQIWNQRSDIQIAKNNLFLAQMGILKAKRARLPRISASLGLGDLYLDSKNDRATIVPGINVSLPLFDVGDSKRLIGKAQKNRDIAKTTLLSNIRRIINDLFDANMKLALSLENIKAAKEDLFRKEQAVKEKKALYDVRRADLLEYSLAQLAKNEQEIQYARAVYDFQKAMTALKEIKGVHVPDELIESL